MGQTRPLLHFSDNFCETKLKVLQWDSNLDHETRGRAKLKYPGFKYGAVCLKRQWKNIGK